MSPLGSNLRGEKTMDYSLITRAVNMALLYDNPVEVDATFIWYGYTSGHNKVYALHVAVKYRSCFLCNNAHDLDGTYYQYL